MDQREHGLIIAVAAHHVAGHHHGLKGLALEQRLPQFHVAADRSGMQVADVKHRKAFKGLVHAHDGHALLQQRHMAVDRLIEQQRSQYHGQQHAQHRKQAAPPAGFLLFGGKDVVAFAFSHFIHPQHIVISS